MHTPSTTRQGWQIVLFTIMALSGPLVPLASAQVMSFSIYTAGGIDEASAQIYTSSTVYDDSTCYSHSNYQTKFQLISPDNSYSAEYNTGGLYGDVRLDIGGYDSDYSVVTRGTFYCPCSQLNMGFGFTQFINSRGYNHHYDFYGEGSPGLPDTFTLNGDSSGRRCSHQSLTLLVTSHAVHMTDNGFYYDFFGAPFGCFSQCSAGWAGAASGPSGPTLSAANCDPPKRR